MISSYVTADLTMMYWFVKVYLRLPKVRWRAYMIFLQIEVNDRLKY